MIEQRDLKPCPFCGASAILKDRWVQGANNKAYWIVCSKCQARTQDRRSGKRAIEAWNNRESEAVGYCNGCKYEDLRGFEPHCRGCIRASSGDNYEGRE